MTKSIQHAPHCPLHVGHSMLPFLDKHNMKMGERIAETNTYFRCPVVQNGVRCTFVSTPEPNTD